MPSLLAAGGEGGGRGGGGSLGAGGWPIGTRIWEGSTSFSHIGEAADAPEPSLDARDQGAASTVFSSSSSSMTRTGGACDAQLRSSCEH